MAAREQSLTRNDNPQNKASKRNKILADFQLLCTSRLVSNDIRREVLTGKAKFGIGSAGKELLQIALADHFKKGDFYSGYYRDQTFMMKKGIARVKDIFSALYGDAQNDKFSGGRQMNGHFSTPFIDEDGNWKNLTEEYNVSSAIAPLAGHVPRALGLALASKKFREGKMNMPELSNNGNELSFCVVGDATAAEGVFLEAVNAACVMQVPIVFVVQDNGYGISVPVELQTAKGSISEALKGLQSDDATSKALEIYKVKGWDYDALQKTFSTATKNTRSSHRPCLIHVTELSQRNGHSTSGSHERYKPEERLQWEAENDCLYRFEQWILNNNWGEMEQIELIKSNAVEAVKKERKESWNNYQSSFLEAKKELIEILSELIDSVSDKQVVHDTHNSLIQLSEGEVSDLLSQVENILYSWDSTDTSPLENLKKWFFDHKTRLDEEYKSHLYSNSAQAAINVGVTPASYTDDSPIVNGYEVLNTYFDQLFARDDKVYAFGEDVGKIGGVNQAFAGLQSKYGVDRVFDTGIREWTIAGQAIGMAARGLRPIGEIQYLDYLVYALPALTDDLATLRWRTKGLQSSPTIIRTRGHRLEGIWHSGSPISMLLGSLRGIHLLTPRNMTQAVGMYNTLLQSDDPGIVIEPLNGYRKKEFLPDNLDDFTVALGSPEILTNGEDITLVTYGSCVEIAQKAAEKLGKFNIQIEVIDVQTMIPFDLESQIIASIKKTNRVIFLDEDVPGGGTAYMMQKVLEEQDGYKYLDSKPITISAKEHRPAYGDDGNYTSKPGVFDVVSAAVKMMVESDHHTFNDIAALFAA